MMMESLVKGLVLGFSVAAPVGPIGLLCMQRTLMHGRLAGFFSGLGATTADALYGAVAAFGFTLVTDFLVRQQEWLQTVGGLFLIYLGIKTLLSKPADRSATAKGQGMWGMYLSTLLLTITNPLTILSFAAMFAGLGVASSASSTGSAVQMVLGVFLGSALWWGLLSVGVGFLKKRISPAILRGVNVVSGGLIAGLGVVALVV